MVEFKEWGSKCIFENNNQKLMRYNCQVMCNKLKKFKEFLKPSHQKIK